MSTRRDPLCVGDIIISVKFAFGQYNCFDADNKKVILVDGHTINQSTGFSLSEEERLDITAKTGKIPPKESTVEVGAYDPSRGIARFVVEEACFVKGDAIYDSGDWSIQARRLNDDGTYNPDGELIAFSILSYDHSSYKINPGDIRIIGKMKRIFIQL
jgi:hypothetical protein